jgi:hypothetical protein
VIEMTYRSSCGQSQTYRFADERLDELLARADAKFLRPMTGEEIARYEGIKRALVATLK